MIYFHGFVRVNEGLSIKLDFEMFDLAEGLDVLNVFEGSGAAKTQTCEFTGCEYANVVN